MDAKRVYRRRGTPDLPIAVYVGIAGKNMDIYKNADYHPEMEITLQVSGSCTMEIEGVPLPIRREIFSFFRPIPFINESDFPRMPVSIVLFF